jgi:hypothetical protein
MSRIVLAEYDANENILRLTEPLHAVRDHEKLFVAIEAPADDERRPWLRLRDSLSAEAGDSLSDAIDEMFAEGK